MKHIILTAAALLLSLGLNAQKYKNGVVDKTVAVLGGETILISDLESEVQQMRMNGASSDRDIRCELLEDAVKAAAENCREGDVVLLSPGGTSYDAFVNFEERGDRFTEWVKALE